MPTPYGTRGGMAFGAEELRVLRRALALALHPNSASAQDIQDCLRLAESVDEAVGEGVRLRAFLLTDLARYRAALPGTVIGYLDLLSNALDAGYRPGPDDLAALRALRGNPAAAALLDRCGDPEERAARTAPNGRATCRAPGRAVRVTSPPVAAQAFVPASRRRLQALPGGLLAADPPARREPGTGDPEAEPAPRRPAPARPTAEPPAPGRPVPTPAEVFPPKRRPAPPAPPAAPAAPEPPSAPEPAEPSEDPQEQLVAG